jgi:hypothetical protein
MDYPGIDYDPVSDKLVAWNNIATLNNSGKAWSTNQVIIYDPVSATCTEPSFSGGPVFNSIDRGTHGKFRWNPNTGTFIAGNNPSADFFSLRLDSVQDWDFWRRSTAPGVVRAYGFDNNADVTAKIRPGTGINGFFDSSTFSSCTNGAAINPTAAAGSCGSLRFDIPVTGNDGAAGSFELQFGVPDGTQFLNSVNDTCITGATCFHDVYIQWRQRFSSTFLTNPFGGQGQKQMILSDGNLSAAQTGSTAYTGPACSLDEIVQQNSNFFNLAQMYHSCGFKDGSFEALQAFNETRNPGNFELENGPTNSTGSTCVETGGGVLTTTADPPCIRFVANTWMTFQYHIHVGTWYQNNHVYLHDSQVQLWVAYEGQPSRSAIDWSPTSPDIPIPPTNATVTSGYDLANQTFGGQYGATTYPNVASVMPPYASLWLLPYMTNRGTNTVPASSTWYDEVIISTQKIADPGFPGSTQTPTVTMLLNPATVNFGNQLQGQHGPAQTIVVTNTGTANLTLQSPYDTLSGTNAGDFVDLGTGTCSNGGVLAASATCTINVQWTAGALGVRSASLNVLSNASNNPQIAVLTGTAVPSIAGTGTITGSGTIKIQP